MRRWHLLGVCAGAVTCSAAVLWDQSDFASGSGRRFSDAELASAYSEYSNYLVSDVLTDGPGWRIRSVSAYFTQSTPGHWAGITRARLNLFPKASAYPPLSDDPRHGIVVPVSMRDLAGTAWEMTAAGLDIELPGSAAYWIGLTPLVDYDQMGTEWHWAAASQIGAETAVWWSESFETYWAPLSYIYGPPAADAAFEVEGDLLPEPAAGALFALIAVGFGRRRS